MPLFQLEKLESDMGMRLQNLAEDNAVLRQTVSQLQAEVTSLKSMSSELQCARNSALAIENDVRDLLSHVIVNGSVLQPENCIPMVVLPHAVRNSTYPRGKFRVQLQCTQTCVSAHLN